MAGDSLRLDAIPKDASGNPLSGFTISYGTSDPSVAVVSPAGMVTAVGSGTVVITATCDGQTAQSVLTVKLGGVVGTMGGTLSLANGAVKLILPPGAVSGPTTMYIDPPGPLPPDGRIVPGTGVVLGPPSLAFGLPITLSLRYDPALIALNLQRSLALFSATTQAWQPVNGSQVDSTGYAVGTPIERAGTFALMAAGLVDTVTVVPDEVMVVLGSLLPLRAEIKDGIGNTLTNRPLTWHSADTTIAKVSQQGQVYGVGLGNTIITVSSAGTTDTSLITVAYICNCSAQANGGPACSCIGPKAPAKPLMTRW